MINEYDYVNEMRGLRASLLRLEYFLNHDDKNNAHFTLQSLLYFTKQQIQTYTMEVKE